MRQVYDENFMNLSEWYKHLWILYVKFLLLTKMLIIKNTYWYFDFFCENIYTNKYKYELI